MVNAGLLQNLEWLSVERGNEARSPAIYLGPEAVAVIAEMLQLEKMPNLKSLLLSNFDFEGEDSLTSLKLALQCDQLHILGELHLVSNRLSGNVTMEIIKVGESRQPIMSNLIVLDLKHNNLGVEEAIAVAEAQRLLRNVQDLELSGNGFGGQGAMAIAGALKSGLMSRLRVLRLSKNGIGDDGIIALVEALKFGKAKSFQSLYLDLNAIGDRGGLYVAEALEKGAYSWHLAQLILFHRDQSTEISTSVQSALESAYENNKQLVLHIHFVNNLPSAYTEFGRTLKRVRYNKYKEWDDNPGK